MITILTETVNYPPGSATFPMAFPFPGAVSAFTLSELCAADQNGGKWAFAFRCFGGIGGDFGPSVKLPFVFVVSLNRIFGVGYDG
jgi:hypothetical protein